ncbi:hypothetical protein CJ030_MR4G000592 [Morella rubra]|uniref:Uncharacterized protein n=1 Tax=Morella rubra TaxID=262757 RepID=A0A6A1VTV9_9ROSI|nr:hypothetical protein CJ030_MR4G000592 [Morella rubra]
MAGNFKWGTKTHYIIFKGPKGQKQPKDHKGPSTTRNKGHTQLGPQTHQPNSKRHNTTPSRTAYTVARDGESKPTPATKEPRGEAQPKKKKEILGTPNPRASGVAHRELGARVGLPNRDDVGDLESLMPTKGRMLVGKHLDVTEKTSPEQEPPLL